MNDIEIKTINREHKEDINLKNEPFTIFGRLIPTYDGESWNYTQELFAKKSELRFPDGTRFVKDIFIHFKKGCVFLICVERTVRRTLV